MLVPTIGIYIAVYRDFIPISILVGIGIPQRWISDQPAKESKQERLY